MNKVIFIDIGMKIKAIDGLLVAPIIILNASTRFRVLCRFPPLLLPESDCTAAISVASMILMRPSSRVLRF
ncbi:MAG: hypothetical protein KAG53_04980 [Endozoicomonadaceae bacterium]|nr:hypothetical protein [Endozoicomonadaceae bacterium]